MYMKKRFLKFILFFSSLVIFLVIVPTQTYAQGTCQWDSSQSRLSLINNCQTSANYIPYYNPNNPSAGCECKTRGTGTTGNSVPVDSSLIQGESAFVTCDDGNDGIDTAIGCIPITDQNALFGFFLKWGLGIAGGLAFLLILFATFQIMTSSGDPKKMQAGKELLTAAISGVVLLIFSVFILRIIAGPSLLNIPFFS